MNITSQSVDKRLIERSLKKSNPNSPKSQIEETRERAKFWTFGRRLLCKREEKENSSNGLTAMAPRSSWSTRVMWDPKSGLTNGCNVSTSIMYFIFLFSENGELRGVTAPLQVDYCSLQVATQECRCFPKLKINFC